MRTKWYEVTGVGLLFIVLGLVSTYPLLQYFDCGIPFGAFRDELTWNKTGDHLQLFYWFWLVKENLLGHVPFDSNPFEFNMLVEHATSGLITFPFSVIFVLFSLLPFGDVAAYNCTVISTYVLAGLFMYLLVKLYSGSKTGALLAALIFCLAPSRINGVTGGNLYASIFFLYPWVVYFLEKGLRARKIRYGILSGLGIVVLSMMEAHLLYYLLLFLIFYIPLRYLALFPEHPDAEYAIEGEGGKILAWSVPRSLLFSWGAGLSVVFYSQILFAYRDQIALFNKYSWLLFAAYPMIPLAIVICTAVLHRRLLPLTFRQTLAISSVSFAPLFLFLPLCLIVIFSRAFITGYVVVFMIVAILALHLYLLRAYLPGLLCILGKNLKEHLRHIGAGIPVVLAIAYVVLWVPKMKAGKMASTIAESGRTLDDVRLYSAKLSDMFTATSNVYLGPLPVFLIGVFFALLLVVLFAARRPLKMGHENTPLTIFFVLAGFISYILSLGLAAGRSSLYMLLYHYLPYFNYPRVSDRIVVLALFAAAVASGLIVCQLQKQRGGFWPFLVGLIMIIAACFQLKDYNILSHTGVTELDRGQDIYGYIQKNRGDGLLLELPLWPGDSHQSSLYQHYIMYDKVPRVNGYSPLVRKDYIESIFWPLFMMNRGSLDEKQYGLLRDLNVSYVTLHDNGDVFPKKVSPFSPLTTLRRLQNSPYLEQVVMDNKIHFKDKDLENNHLFLFRVKNEREVGAGDTSSPAWYDMPYIYDPSNRMRNYTGERIEDKALGKTVFHAVAETHHKGYLARGPFSYAVPGDYRCYFFVKTGQMNTDTVAASIEIAKTVNKDEEPVVIATRDIMAHEAMGRYVPVYVDFTLDKVAKMDFRLLYQGEGEVWFQQAALYRKGQDVPLYDMSAFKMVGDVGHVVDASGALNGKVVEGVAGGKKARGDLVFGPDRILEAGKYTVIFYLRAPQKTEVKPDTVAIRLRVTDGRGEREFVRRNIKVKELENTFSAFALDISLADRQELSFHVATTGRIGVQVDRIELKKNED